MANLDSALKTGALACYEPVAMDNEDRKVRKLLFRSTVSKRLDLEKGDIPEAALLDIHDVCHNFVTGGQIRVAPAGPGGVDADFKGLQRDPGVFWEMKLTTEPEYRIIGVFPEKDVFVGLIIEKRSELAKGFFKHLKRAEDIWTKQIKSSMEECVCHEKPELALSNWSKCK